MLDDENDRLNAFLMRIHPSIGAALVVIVVLGAIILTEVFISILLYR